MNVKLLDLSNKAESSRWDQFVGQSSGSTFFHLSGWGRVLRDTFQHQCHYLYAERDGDIVGILPLCHVSSWLFGSSLSSVPFAVYGGVVAGTDSAAVEALELAAEGIARKLGVGHLEFRNLSQRHGDWPTQDLYVTFRKEIASELEENLNSIPRKQRAMVRKGIKNGLQSEIDCGVDRFFQLYAGNVHRHGTPGLPKSYFLALQKEFGEAVEILTVSDATGLAVSSVLSFYFKDEVLPYYAGDHVLARDVAANDFKYWELMRRACERGVKVFDYGRSKQGTGSYAFKKNWGFEPQPLSYEYRLFHSDSIPQNNPSNAKFKLLIAAWRRLPLGVVNWLGPKLVRSLG